MNGPIHQYNLTASFLMHLIPNIPFSLSNTQWKQPNLNANDMSVIHPLPIARPMYPFVTAVVPKSTISTMGTTMPLQHQCHSAKYHQNHASSQLYHSLASTNANAPLAASALVISLSFNGYDPMDNSCSGWRILTPQ